MNNDYGIWFFATATLVAALVGYSITQYYDGKHLTVVNNQLLIENKRMKNNLHDPIIRGIMCVKPFKQLNGRGQMSPEMLK